MRHRLFILLFALLATTLLPSCVATYQVESNKKVERDDARLIIYRKGIVGFAVGTKIFANGKFVGTVGPRRYISCYLPPGEYLMSVGTSRFDEVFFKVNMAAGKTYAYYFTYSMRRGYGGRPWVRKMENPMMVERHRPPVVNYFN
ncbi:hypothetical protein GCM10023093_18670 [Nemorincola caseinilytica]|uniref:DUF2846 domain-containing protein n=1 Tax=Nemorincola caseinilytica TaxID=2054315 RepID=A0ABP8NG75_9BACT